MALKECNRCSARWYDGEECPQCLGAGEGEVRDYHFAHDENPPDEQAGSQPPEATGSESDGEAAAGLPSGSEPPDDEGDADDPFPGYSRNQLSSLAKERGLDATGTRDELLARLTEDDSDEE